MGKALLAAAEADARALGASGMAAWGIWPPPSGCGRPGSGSRVSTSGRPAEGMQVLVWKPFTPGAQRPRWIREKKKRPQPVPGQVTVTSFRNGWCPGMNMAFERAKRAAAEFGDKVEFRAVDTFDRAAFREWGEPDAIFVDGRGIRMGPPPSYEKIRKAIAKKVKDLG